MVKVKCRHLYHRIRHDPRDRWYVFCDLCGASFEPKKGVSIEDFDAGFDKYFAALDKLPFIKQEK